MKSLQAPEQIASPTVGNAKHRLASLSSLIGLSAGALGWSSLASANDEGRDLQTLILPDTYSALDDGTVILQLETGEQLTLTADQYVMLDGGLLLVVDELAQNSVAELPVLGSLRTQLFTEVQPVRSPDGSIIEATNQQPLWSGEGPAPRLFEEIDIQRFEIAQDQQGEDEDDEGLFLGGAGGALVGIGITTLGIMNTGAADDDGDESTDGGGSDGGGSSGSGHVCPPDDIQLVAGSTGFVHSYMGALNNELYYQGTYGGSLNGLIKYDGSAYTVIANTTTTDFVRYPHDLTTFQDKLVFDAQDGTGDWEVHVYDGVNITKFELGGASDGAYPDDFVVFDNKLYFEADNGTDGDELWVWDGNLLNTPTMVGNFNSGSGDFRPFDMTVFSAAGGIVFGAYDGTIAAGSDLYFYDGTGSPVRVGGDMNPTGSNFVTTNNQASFHEWNGKIYFNADDGTNGKELWVWDGNTANAPTMIGPAAGGLVAGDLALRGITDLNGKLYFSGKDSGGDYRLYEYDGISDPSPVPGSPAGVSFGPIKFNNKVYFEGDDGTTGDEIWSYDGINPPTLVEDIAPGATNGSRWNLSTSEPFVLDDRLYLYETTNGLSSGGGLYYIEAC